MAYGMISDLDFRPLGLLSEILIFWEENGWINACFYEMI